MISGFFLIIYLGSFMLMLLVSLFECILLCKSYVISSFIMPKLKGNCMDNSELLSFISVDVNIFEKHLRVPKLEPYRLRTSYIL